MTGKNCDVQMKLICPMNVYLGCVAPCNYFEYKVQTIDEDHNPELVSYLVLESRLQA